MIANIPEQCKSDFKNRSLLRRPFAPAAGACYTWAIIHKEEVLGMDPFVFHNVTRFVFGPQAEQRAGEEIAALGARRLLLVYGQGSAERSGLLDRVKASLAAHEIGVLTLGGVQPNPLSDKVYEGIELARREQADGLLAIGGGSAIDTAKAIALGVPYAGDFWDLFSGKATPSSALPVFCVPTIAAAGSESSNSAVITHKESLLKRGIRNELNRPRLSLMNPELTYSVPPIQKACGIADMMAHIFERYFTNTRSVMLSDELCEGVLRTVIKAGPRALKHPEDYDAHADLMWAGTLAHNDTLSPGRQQDWSSHAMAHAVSARFGAPHGGVLAVLFPYWMKYQLEHDVDRFRQFAVKVMRIKPDDKDKPRRTAEEGIAKLRGFFNKLGLPEHLSELGVHEDDLEALVGETPFNAEGKVGFFRPLDAGDVMAIYRKAL